MTRANKIAPLLLTLIGACLVLMAAESVNRLMSTGMVAVAFAEGGDDGYYYLTVARNAARGLGVTVDGVEWTSGFQPLWALVCTTAYLDGKMRVTALRALQNGKLYEEIMRGDFDYVLLHGFDSAFFDERGPGWRQHYGEIGEFDKLVVYKRR